MPNINILPAEEQHKWCNKLLEGGDDLSDSEGWEQNKPFLLPPNHPICSESDQWQRRWRGGWEWGLIRAKAKGHRQRSIWRPRPTFCVRRRTVAPLAWCLHCQHGQALQNKCIGQQNAWFMNSTKSRKRALLVANLISVFVFTFPCINHLSTVWGQSQVLPLASEFISFLFQIKHVKGPTKHQF